MAFQTWITMINADSYSGENKGPTIKNTTESKDISPGENIAGQALTIPASFLVPGHLIRYSAVGIISTTGKPKIKMGLYYGGIASGVALVSEEVEAVEGGSSNTWYLEATSRVIEVGTAGKMLTQGNVTGLEAKSAIGTSAGTTMLPSSSATGGESASIETGVAKTITLGIKWGTASESNSITCYQWIVEILN